MLPAAPDAVAKIGPPAELCRASPVLKPVTAASANLLLLVDQQRLANRLTAWRATPAQTAFHGLAMATAAALAFWVLAAQRESLQGLLALAQSRPDIGFAGLLMLAALDQRAAQRRLLDRWRGDWLAAQPLPQIQRLAYRAWRSGGRFALQALGLTLLLAWLDGSSPLIAAALLATLAGSLLGATSAGWRLPQRRRLRRHSPFLPRGRGSLWRWQRQCAGSALAPRSVAPLIALWLLVPRGPALMLGVALCLLALALLASAWRRMLGVFAAAHGWLAAEGIAARRWVGRALLLPGLILSVGGTLCATLLWLFAAPPAFQLLWLACLMLACLSLLACAAERRTPRRAALVLAVHAALLAGCSQALPPLLPLLFALQCGHLLWRSLR